MNTHGRIVALQALAAAFLFPAAVHAGAETVRMADGRAFAGTLRSVDAANVVMNVGNELRTVPVAEVAEIVFETKGNANFMASRGQQVVVTSDGTRIGLRALTIEGGKLQGESDAAGRITLELDDAERVLRPRRDETPDRLEQQVAPAGLKRGANDTIVVYTVAGQTAVLDGILISLTDKEAKITVGGSDTGMGSDLLAVFVPAASRPQRKRNARRQVVLVDDARIAGTEVHFQAGEVVVQSDSLGLLRLKRESVASIRYVAAEAVCLSDLTPTEVEHVPFFDDEFPWRKDRAVSGRVLTLDGHRYEKGLGMHAQCRMVFDLRREYRRFTAVAGIDGNLRHGRASLSVTGDGKSLIERLVLDRGKSAAPIALDVNGVEKLAVCVDFIEDTFGVGARVNLCDAVLAK